MRMSAGDDLLLITFDTLRYDVAQKAYLFDGSCPKTVQLLKEKRAPADPIRELRKAKPMRQIEVAELRCAVHNFSSRHAKGLVVAIPAELMVDSERSKDINSHQRPSPA